MSEPRPTAENDARLLEWAADLIVIEPNAGCASCVNNAEASAETYLRRLAHNVRAGRVLPPGEGDSDG